MSFSRLFLSAAVATAACGLVSCGSAEKIDVKYPTVQQMDALDVQWGLPPRKSRGSPSRSLAYDAAGSVPAATAPVVASPAVANPTPSPVAPVPASTVPAVVVPDQLR